MSRRPRMEATTGKRSWSTARSRRKSMRRKLHSGTGEEIADAILRHPDGDSLVLAFRNGSLPPEKVSRPEAVDRIDQHAKNIERSLRKAYASSRKILRLAEVWIIFQVLLGMGTLLMDAEGTLMAWRFVFVGASLTFAMLMRAAMAGE